eukprot:TRINITY_DN30818_c0_g1_i1.p1 TRINITY_DN30818_c0_g1~~TRINITY_DN30818_c0_g1_i1.p1  ORF type:complete len:440 (-),score=110.90 TRINITY_DN30818_c0_g1_i1:63-1382(-)
MTEGTRTPLSRTPVLDGHRSYTIHDRTVVEALDRPSDTSPLLDRRSSLPGEHSRSSQRRLSFSAEDRATHDDDDLGDSSKRPLPQHQHGSSLFNEVDAIILMAALINVLSSCVKKLNPFHKSVMQYPEMEIYASIFVTIVTRTAVPLLMMAYGYRVIPEYKDSAPNFFRRYFRLVVAPVCCWGAVLFAKGLLMAMLRGDSFTWGRILSILYDSTLSSTLPANMHFFWALYSLILVTPILSLFMREGHFGVLVLSLVLWFLADPLQDTLSRNWDVHSPFIFQIQGFRGIWTGYYVLGGMLGCYGYRPAFPELVLSAIVYAATVSVVFVRTAILTFRRENGVMQEWTIESGAPVVLLTIPLFFLTRAMVDNRLMRSRLMRFVGDHAFAIVLTHGLFVDMLIQKWGSVRQIPWAFVMSFVMSFGLAFLLRRLPLLKKMFAFK